ncbi:Putative effector of murein hydrolase [Ferrimonas sediminum]|uniref:Putative effector of murein hydrolase n=1 Tax=Ferrimonas sediminum TaxID=718193 RepID=A0A1G8UFQ0_9GAMM|nr:LrgB family protein [Ferrimonas sediminum]SDJ52633.1 Putative effector of murein hydrolase [Ferrimonas sediminum]
MPHTSLLALMSLFLTLASYYGAKALYHRRRRWWLAPIILAPLTLIGLVSLLAIPLPTYYVYTHWLMALLAPATIAFAVPIYRERKLIRQYPLTLTLGVASGLLFGLLSSWCTTKLLPLPADVVHSVLVRSVSTPFAVEATTAFGGIPDLTAILVLLTGIIGMLIGEPILKLARIRSALARGVALGASAHGAGAAKATEMGQQEGVIASLAMVFTGVAMVLSAPLFAAILV